ncbi:protein of unknown function [Xenorhabdus poinarii G6]|uniref:Uncharacterized protein n=1 Tax=Xenorhabdus poinarii G6 TaxID=1354304 RepID=A0A068R3M4_9GAMM|nr:protein of unknown function [Xenorhabdus poinarii G6]
MVPTLLMTALFILLMIQKSITVTGVAMFCYQERAIGVCAEEGMIRLSGKYTLTAI